MTFPARCFAQMICYGFQPLFALSLTVNCVLMDDSMLHSCLLTNLPQVMLHEQMLEFVLRYVQLVLQHIRSCVLQFHFVNLLEMIHRSLLNLLDLIRLLLMPRLRR